MFFGRRLHRGAPFVICVAVCVNTIQFFAQQNLRKTWTESCISHDLQFLYSFFREKHRRKTVQPRSGTISDENLLGYTLMQFPTKQLGYTPT